MRLSTRLSIAMVALVLITAATIAIPALAVPFVAGQPSVAPAAIIAILGGSAIAILFSRSLILHIDDDENVLSIVADTLRFTCDVVSVPSMAAARAAMAAHHFDLAVLDLLLSQASGLDLLPELRDRDGNAIPVILYSAKAANGKNAEQVQAALTKSHASIDQLIATLRRHAADSHAPAHDSRSVA